MTRYTRLRHDSTLRLTALVFAVLAGLALGPAAAGAAECGAAIRPFTVAVPEATLTDLRQRVRATRWPAAETVLPGAVRTTIWEKSGTDIDTLPAANVMDAEAMVDAALAGLDAGEPVTIPSMPDAADWDAWQAARRALLPNLSRSMPAPRYRTRAATAAGGQ